MWIGFLNPDGNFFKCETYNHINFGAKLIEENYKVNYYINPEYELSKRGWLIFNEMYIGFSGIYPMITNEQIEWILQHCDEFTHVQQKSLSVALELDQMYKNKI